MEWCTNSKGLIRVWNMQTAVEPDAAPMVQTFEQFYIDEYSTILRLAWSLTGSRELAEDLTQDGFLAARRNWTVVVAKDRPGAWLRRVVLNQVVSWRRRRAAELRSLARFGASRVDTVDLVERDDELWAAVRSLSRRQSQVVALIYVDQCSVDEAAVILSCGPETVRTHLRRGKARLAEILNESASTGEEPIDDA